MPEHRTVRTLLLSRPQPDANSVSRAKEEFQKELQIDPRNAGAEYILGEMARQDSQLEEALVFPLPIPHLKTPVPSLSVRFRVANTHWLQKNKFFES